jgi:5-methylcytosine-specific restriction protein A
MQVALKRGDCITNNQLHQIFGVSTNGGMRKSNANKCLVLTYRIEQKIYDDRWQGDTLLYTGMGQIGDQSFDHMQNKTLAESRSNGIAVYLFKYTGPNKYVYEGPVKLAADPYYAQAPDQSDQMRRVAIFPLKRVQN